MTNKLLSLLIPIFLLSCSVEDKNIPEESVINTGKPYTYWWWTGSSVTKKGITRNLEDISIAGIGGVHIIPVYGRVGDESNYVPYLSPEWMELLKYTIEEGERLGIAVDMTTGTGWPFGGPDVSTDDAAKFLYIEKIRMDHEINLNDYQRPENHTRLVALAGYDQHGNFADMTSLVDSSGFIRQDEVDGSWEVYAAFQGATMQNVKRAAPGGEGLVLDYFDDDPVLRYMRKFEKAFEQAGIKKGEVRSFYNDSYEVYGANWTADFLNEFKERRKYDLLPYIKHLADTGSADIKQRIITDYCETVADLLHEEFTKNWVERSHNMEALTRNQAHGSPGNLLDLYALADIPETESFGASDFRIPGLRQDEDYEEERFGRPNPLTMKFASSAAHVTGKQLVSSESTTWLGDHFKVSLSQIKPQMDELFVSGINHVFFHGTTYSPKEEPFPGRLFYASTHYGPTSHFWNELPHLTGYIARCQKMLINSTPDNDILLYFPIHEIWRKQKTRNFIRLFDVHKSKEWLQDSNFGSLAKRFWDQGFAFDFISDRMISSLKVKDNRLITGKTSYKTIVVPSIECIPEETLAHLNNLAKAGATIIFENDIPSDVPGLFEYKQRRDYLKGIRNNMKHQSSTIFVTPHVEKTLMAKDIFPEAMASAGLEYIRKKSGDRTLYFVTNLSDRFREGWIKLTVNAKNVEIYDPLNNRKGLAAIRNTDTGMTSVYIRLLPGQSCILTCTGNSDDKEKWTYIKPNPENKIEIGGEWSLIPEQGAPVIPEPVTISQLVSWTTLGEHYKTFSGKVLYKITFEVPLAQLKDEEGFMLDLGVVRETARVTINEKDLGLVWCLPTQLYIPPGIIREENTMEIEVTNLSINRIIQLDKKEDDWKAYHGTRFVNIRYEPYDASNKKPVESGLLSGVSLIPVSRIEH